MKKRKWPGLLGLVAFFGVCLLVMHLVAEWYSTDRRAVRECSSTYFVCVSTVTAKLPLDSRRSRVPEFDAEAWSCEQYTAWELAIARAKFDCQMSSKVQRGTCVEKETSCELTGR